MSTKSRLLVAVALTIGFAAIGAKAQPNPGGGWQGPYYVGPDSTGGTPVANPGSILNPYYGALGNLYYSGNTVTYNWGGATARDAEFVYYGSFMLQEQSSNGSWFDLTTPSTSNGGGYSDPDSSISTSAGSTGPSVTFQWDPGAYFGYNQNLRVVSYIYVLDQGSHPGWYIFMAYSNTVTTPGSPPPTVSISGAPGSAYQNTTISPQANASEGGAPLQTVILSYSWDNANWTELAANPNPANPNDSEGNPIGLGQQGTLYLKAEAWDNQGGYANSTASVSVLPPPFQPVTFFFSPTSFTYNGQYQGPGISTQPGGGSFNVGGTPSAVAAGTYTVTATATGQFQGQGSANYTIGQAQPAIYSEGQTISYGTQNWAPGIWNTGSSADNYFAIVGYTGWIDGTQGGTWTPPGPGSYSFEVYNPGDANYAADWNGYYTLNVTAGATTITFSNLDFNYDGNTHSASVQASAGTVTSSSLSAGPNAGSYGVSATVNDGQYYGTGSATLTISQANSAAPTISPPSSSIFTGQSVTFTATGGTTGNFAWGSSASGAGSSKTVTFNSPDNYTVTVQDPGDANHSASGLATATVAVTTPTYALTVLAGAGGTASGGATGLFWNSTPTVTATPDATHGFAGWSGDTVTNPSSATTTVPMNSGNRTVTAGFVALTPGSLVLSGAGNFANAYRDTIAGSPTTTSLTVTLSNPGQLPITISSLTLAGPFAVLSGPTLPTTLNGGASLPLVLIFTPGTSVGSDAGTLTVVSSANSQSMNLSGTGMAPQLGINWQ
jgi:hypothetical protein